MTDDCSDCTELAAVVRLDGRARSCRTCGARLRLYGQRPDVARDLANLALMLPVIECSSVAIDALVDHDRAEQFDRLSGRLHWACRILRRLDAMLAAGHVAHVAVLWAAYVHSGDSHRERGRTYGGFGGWIGLVFARPGQRWSWLTNQDRKQGLGMAYAHGTRLLLAATAAYHAVPIDACDPVPDRPRLALDTMRHVVESKAAAARDEWRVILKAVQTKEAA